MTPDPTLPLSHPVAVETIKPRGSVVRVEADAAALSTLARVLDLASVESVVARYDLTRNGERVKLEGTIEAALHQTCIVTLEPFPVSLSVPVRLDFAPQVEISAAAAREGIDEDGKVDVEVRLNEDDPPEPILDGMIDLGAVTQEFLALALDPYPRKPGAAFDAPAAGPAVESPFAALARLKRSE
ncbi:YceD family protein [Bosea sp. PAMC 26642]|uniref:YceD family protein n=1 Tax=Bosea sp. (strain PAMC 26642) TaxID=1792307 RepID=UPI0007706614|nr:DUF177 domain-containing protein [Bosea sp. PAMC 26642]AMJ59546.1 hypothetical protein AXW83_03820 [Bosea sp. PAMC 26642]